MAQPISRPDQEEIVHAAALDGAAPLESSAALGADTLLDGVLILLVLTVLQRMVGFLREILFCRWLDAEQLGQWDMSFGFLMLAGPLVVLSLPGTFGRYVERYRQQGQLRSFLRRTAVVCAAMALPAAAVVYWARPWFSQLIFGRPDQTLLVALLGGALLAMVAFTFLTCLFTALRNMRLVSGMELVSSMIFAASGIALLCLWQCSAASVVVAYGMGCLLTSLGALWWLKRMWHTLPVSHAPLPQRTFWWRLLPFTAWLLVINLLTNLFDLADRQMIIHCSSADALAEVGNYRSSRVLPLLLTTVTAMIAAVATPHLSHDWEAGRRGRVSAQMNLLLKVLAAALTTIAVAMLAIAPLLFQVAFRGKYAGGLAVMPWTLIYCSWFGLAIVAQKYLWCAERAGRVSAALLLGLAVNVSLNLLLLPRLGLLGAVLATVAAHGVALLLIVIMSSRLGFRVHVGTWAALLLPALVCLGAWNAALCLLIIASYVMVSDRLLSREEKRLLSEGIGRYLVKFRGWRWGRRMASKGT
jgi:O-antigen/teichoic acid export membrane protein